MRNLVIIFGDQLSTQISSLSDFDKTQDHVMMMEVFEEASYVKHHKKKLAFIFSAMRHFHSELRDAGINATYFTLDAHAHRSFEEGLVTFLRSHLPKKIILTSPSEYRVLEKVKSWEQLLNLPVDIRQDTRFLCSKAQFQHWASHQKTLTMEFFYREMRKAYDVLMEGKKPVGGQWNFDKQNRKSIPKNQKVPPPLQFSPDETTQAVIALVKTQFHDHFGDLDAFEYAVTRRDALKALTYFIENLLPNFGDYQDAMLENEPWLFHSILSHYINSGLLLPRECIEAALNAYKLGHVPINAAEGYIRQILGWREYVNGIYWLKMPGYESLNHLAAGNPLPSFFWGGDTKLNCLQQCIQDTKAHAYAHHIQRLMVLGNFCLLIGVDPKFVNEWYLIVYADAYEWVEMPNVSGMILYADGGYLGSKPYAASGSYINKMSNYCKNCKYNVKEKVGPEACPFNYLYWDFVQRNRDTLSSNHRMRMIYATLDKMKAETLEQITHDARAFIDSITEEN